MDFNDLVHLYETWKKQHGKETYRYMSALLGEAKELHYQDWLKHPTAGGSHNDSWRSWKGKNLEKLIVYMMREEVEESGLKIIQGLPLERSNPDRLSHALNMVRRNLLVRFGTQGEFGFHLPDVDIIIYDPQTYRIFAVISTKTSLRERIAQTGYWKIKLSRDKITQDIKVFFLTTDIDGTLTKQSPMKKGRAIVETDTDGTYLMTEETVEASSRVKSFDQLIPDLRKLISAA